MVVAGIGGVVNRKESTVLRRLGEWSGNSKMCRPSSRAAESWAPIEEALYRMALLLLMASSALEGRWLAFCWIG